MRSEQTPSETLPQFLTELHAWIRGRLRLEPAVESALLAAIDAVFSHHERRWQESKQDAMEALSAAFAEKMARVQQELSDKDATISTISRYFENLVADLTDKSQRDPKTKLMNFARFTDQLELFLALEQRGTWCAVGLVDVTAFKWYNDALGHAVGDRIIERVAQLLRGHVRSDDCIARERRSRHSEDGGRDLHARFGGDEFCFLIPELKEPQQAYAVAERFRQAVQRYDWASEDGRLARRPVRVDVGVVCLWLGAVTDRRVIARSLSAALIQRADQLMYEAKEERAGHISLGRLRVVDGQLFDIPDAQESAATRTRG